MKRTAKRWQPDEILAQIKLTRARRGATGNVHFSIKALDPREGLGRALRDGPYYEPALIPASPWLDDDPPAAPELDLQGAADGGLEMRWAADRECWVAMTHFSCFRASVAANGCQ